MPASAASVAKPELPLSQLLRESEARVAQVAEDVAEVDALRLFLRSDEQETGPAQLPRTGRLEAGVAGEVDQVPAAVTQRRHEALAAERAVEADHADVALVEERLAAARSGRVSSFFTRAHSRRTAVSGASCSAPPLSLVVVGRAVRVRADQQRAAGRHGAGEQAALALLRGREPPRHRRCLGQPGHLLRGLEHGLEQQRIAVLRHLEGDAVRHVLAGLAELLEGLEPRVLALQAEALLVLAQRDADALADAGELLVLVRFVHATGPASRGAPTC